MTVGGCLFTNGTHVLAGLQTKHGLQMISGFGGKALENEDSLHAAMRETIEELFEIFDAPMAIDEILMNFIPRKFLHNGDYTILVYDFHDLHDFMLILAGHHLQSPLYQTFPMTFEELLLKRQPREQSEIQSLALLPFDATMQLDSLFLSDLVLLAKN